MAQPVLIIKVYNSTTRTYTDHDYTQYVGEMQISRNDLDADGSGRDVKTGLFYRKRIAIKMKCDISMIPLDQSTLSALSSDIKPQFYEATVLDPETGARVTKTFYTSSVPYGAQRYDKDTGNCYYSGVSFSMTEK